jgi:elongation of very long chain fatty acids protein 6
MKMHSSVIDANGVTQRWVFVFELALFDQRNLFRIERFMDNWWWLSIPYALFYIIIVFIGQAWMRKNNKKFELRGALIVWNTFLAIFSFWGACRCVPEFLYSLNHHGFFYSICDPSYKKGITGLW